MSEQVLYRKYRPTSFLDVKGQDHIISALSGALEKGSISHAYLFAGSRGTGKTSVARILARELGCSQNDLYEIDAASNRGIDDVRELKESVRALPFDSEYKVYIIDEVHMLTKEAFNALLKTLEEPPDYVVFILATTEIGKLPETVISRCQTFHFKKPTSKTLGELVREVAKKEGYQIDNTAATLVALLGDDSFRDTLGILQKIINALPEKTISVDMVEKITGAPRVRLVYDYVEGIVKKDLDKSLAALHRVASEDIDMLIFAKLVLRTVRIVLLLKFIRDEKTKEKITADFADDDIAFLNTLAHEKDVTINSYILTELLVAIDHMRFASIPSVPLEVAALRIIEDK